MRSLPNHLILFDGVCNFCDQSVQWIIRQDKSNQFFFASLQSPLGQQVLSHYGIDRGQIDSVVYLRNQKAHIKSTAALYVLKDLGGWMSAIFIFILLPTFLRDFIYDQFAKRRYLLFGKKEECMIPSKEMRNKFLNDATDDVNFPS